MARMTETDKTFRNAISRFISDYNCEINFLQKELAKEKRKSKRLEDILVKDGKVVEYDEV